MPFPLPPSPDIDSAYSYEHQTPWWIGLPWATGNDNSGTVVTNPYNTSELAATRLVIADGLTGRVVPIEHCAGSIFVQPMVAGATDAMDLTLWRLHKSDVDAEVSDSTRPYLLYQGKKLWLGLAENAERDNGVNKQTYTAATAETAFWKRLESRQNASGPAGTGAASAFGNAATGYQTVYLPPGRLYDAMGAVACLLTCSARTIFGAALVKVF